MGLWRTALFVFAGAVFVLGFWVVTRDLRVTPCPGYSEPLDEPDLLGRVWQLPVVARPVLLEGTRSKSPMTSFPTSGRDVFELGAILVIEDWNQSGTDAHTLGPRSIRLSLAPKEGSWGDLYRSVYDAEEYLPVDTELRYDAVTDTHVVVVLNANPGYGHPPPKGTLLPALPAASPVPKVENRGFAFRVTQHTGGHRLRNWKLLAAAGAGYLLAIVSLVIARRRTGSVGAHVACTLGLLLAALALLFAWP